MKDTSFVSEPLVKAPQVDRPFPTPDSRYSHSTLPRGQARFAMTFHLTQCILERGPLPAASVAPVSATAGTSHATC